MRLLGGMLCFVYFFFYTIRIPFFSPITYLPDNTYHPIFLFFPFSFPTSIFNSALPPLFFLRLFFFAFFVFVLRIVVVCNFLVYNTLRDLCFCVIGPCYHLLIVRSLLHSFVCLLEAVYLPMLSTVSM